jgi:glutathione S-transferase
MLKLYYAPGACSISPHVALREAQLPFSLEKVDFKLGKKLADGTAFATINPKGYVPALKLADGRVVTEVVAIVQYVADLKPESRLAPPCGTFERVRLHEWLNFIATELHKGLGSLFGPLSTQAIKDATREKFAGRLAFVETSLSGQQWLLGDSFSVADGYLLYFLRTWQRAAHGTLTPALADYYARLLARPAVQAAIAAEGLP